MAAFGVEIFFAIGDGADLIVGGKLGVSLETGVSAGVDVIAGVCVAAGPSVVVGLGVVLGVSAIPGVGLRRERGLGLIALACGNGATEEAGVWLGGTDGDGEMVGVGEAFLLFRCFGVGAGRMKSFFNFS